MSLHPSGFQEAAQDLTVHFHLSLCPLQFWRPLFLPTFLLPFSTFIYPKNRSPALGKRCASPGSVWLVVVSLFHHVEPALWASSVSSLSHQTEGSPGQGCSPPILGLPRARAACFGHDAFLPLCPRPPPPPPGTMVAERAVPPCSRDVLRQVCLE